MSEYEKFRMKFEKTGPIKYISHLDLSRLFSRSLARAELDVAHSEGFNPHPKIAFASALSLGTESLCEFADAKMRGIETGAEIVEKAKGAFPPGINILDAYRPERDLADIDRSRFHIYVSPDGFGIPELEKFFGEGVSVEKKPGIFVDSRDYICEMAISRQDSGNILIDAALKTNARMYLGAENMIKALSSKYAVGEYLIRKIESYDIEGNVFR